MPSRYVGTESISISGVTGGSQQLTVLEAEVSLTGNGWQKHPIVTGPEAPCILGIDCLRNGYFKDPKGYHWAFGIVAVQTEDIRQLKTLPGLSDDPSAVGLLRAEELQVTIATATVHHPQYRTNRDSVAPINEMIRKLESQGVVSKARSPFNSPIWPVRKSSGERRLMVDYCGLNEVTPALSAAVPNMLELQYELESKAAKWYATIDIANAFFSIPLAAECRPQFTFTWRGVQYTWNPHPQGWKHSPTICHGLIQAALEKGEAPKHLPYIDNIIVWGNATGEVFEKGEIIQILLKAGFAIKQREMAKLREVLAMSWLSSLSLLSVPVPLALENAEVQAPVGHRIATYEKGEDSVKKYVLSIAQTLGGLREKGIIPQTLDFKIHNINPGDWIDDNGDAVLDIAQNIQKIAHVPVQK
ncbi:hypothetical protein HGM15179_018707 [Zosterops borbonicus]|uniref:ribonuclease H n=1 Tax=Zosterops borbonicus TaxID=364589 RepID=A0A8K1D9H4_9PASS|nr:hypothetical protein HGM15179_018707 [Zosterops borbonicus]